jgi:hypothetical protein
VNSGDPVSPSIKSYWLFIAGAVESLSIFSRRIGLEVKAQLFLALNLHNLAVMDSDFNRAVSYFPDSLGDL